MPKSYKKGKKLKSERERKGGIKIRNTTWGSPRIQKETQYGTTVR
jgi:hypothetical protein